MRKYQCGSEIVKNEDKIMKVIKNGYLKTSDLKKIDVSKHYLSLLQKEKVIEKVSRGLYLKCDELNDRLFEIQFLSNKCIFSNLTALYFHGYSNRIPLVYDVTVPRDYSGSLQHIDNVDLYYVDKEVLNLGVTTIIDEFGNELKCYDLERSICDIIKNKNKLDSELVNKALRQFFFSVNKNPIKLFDYAKKLKVYKKMMEVFEVLS